MEIPHSSSLSSSHHTPSSSSSPSSSSPASLSSPSLFISSADERNADRLQEEYETIDKLLQKAQEDLTALSTDVILETTIPSPDQTSSFSRHENQFISLSSADRNHYLDFINLSDPSHLRQDSPVKPQKVERPGTLSRPVLLPSCCRFKAKPWHSLVTGDYSYSKINSVETETETNSSDYKRDLDDIMRELELYLERDKNGNIGNSEGSLSEDADQVKTEGLFSPNFKSLQFLSKDSRTENAKTDENMFQAVFSNSHEDLDTANNNPPHSTRTTLNDNNCSTNAEITDFTKYYNQCEGTSTNRESSIYPIQLKPKRRSRTLSPSRLYITQNTSAFDSGKFECNEKKLQAFSNTDDLSLRKIKKRSHYAGLKTNGCLRNRDPVSVHNKANEILLQKFMSKTNPSNECWSFSPFDYKINSLSSHRCCKNFPNQASTNQIQKQISNQPPLPNSQLSNQNSKQTPNQPPYPIARPPNQILEQVSKEIPNHCPHRISSEIAFPSTRRTSNPFLGKKLRAFSKENLLDKLHRTFYPGLYRSGSNNNNNNNSNNDKRISGRRSSLDNNINNSPPKNLLCSKSFAYKDQDLANDRTRSMLSKTSLKSSSNGKNPDSGRSLPVTPAKEQPTCTDQKLMQTCWWLILSGFPEYIQMYKDDKMPITEEQLLEDHHFLESEEMEFLKKRILILNQLYMKKIQIPSAAYSKMASFQEFQHSLSWKWTYDRLSCSWIRTNQAEPHSMSRTSTKESLSSSSSPTTSSSSSSSSSTVSADKTMAKDWTVQREQVPCNDSNSLHMTSGYESEVSPVSTNNNRKTATPTTTLRTASTTTTAAMNADVNHNYELLPRVGVEKICNDSFFSSSASLKHSSNFKRISRDSQKEYHSHDDIISTSSQRHHHHHHHRHHNHHHQQQQQQITSSPEVSPPHCLFPRTRRRSGFYDNELPDTSSIDDATLELDLILSEFYRDIGEEATDEVQDGVAQESDATSLVNQEEIVQLKEDQVFSEPNQPSEELKPEPESLRSLNVIKTRSISTDEKLERLVSMELLAAPQFAVLKKLATLKISGIFDRFDLPSDFLCSIEKIKDAPIPSQDKLFGVYPSVYLRRTGKSLSPAIASLMSFIEDSSKDSVGIFRKPGVQSRILSLQKHIDQFADETFDTSLDVDPYDAADVFKRYLRDLPETLLTESLCSSFSLIFSSLPNLCVTECLQYLMILLPDVNRSILYEVLHFLHRISQHSTLNQMTPANMAVCFLPSLFRMNDSQSSTGTASNSNVLSQAPLNWDHKSALMCLTHIIERPQETFCIPRNLLEIVDKILDHLSTFTFVDTYLRIHSFHQTQTPDYIAGFLFSSMKHFKMHRGWSQLKFKSFPEATVSVGSERNGSFLSSWKCHLDILAPPVEIINKIHKDSQPWVGHMLTQTVLERKVVEKNKIHHEVVSYEFLLPSDISSGSLVEDEGFLASHKRRTSELRAWKTDLPKESCFYCSKSILEDKRRTSDGETREVHIVESSFFLEPCGEGLTSLTHISTVDLIGHSADWYEAAFPTIILEYFTNLQLYFRQKIANASGPETKV